MAANNVRDVCAKMLKGLDEDIFEYVAGALEEAATEGNLEGDEDTREETIEMVSGFLEPAEYCDEDDENAPRSLAESLVARVIASSKQGESKSSNPSGLQKLSDETRKMTLSLGEATAVTAEDIGASTSTNKNELIEDQTAKSSKKKGDASNKSEKKRKEQYELAERQAMELEEELKEAKIQAIKARNEMGAYKGSIDASSFTLPNPGGGQPLLEDATCRFNWGRRYGLIGRNGMGKSTMLKALAARRVGDIPPNTTVHYVSQEVNLTDAQRMKSPVEYVIEADVERLLLLEELEKLNILADAGNLDAKGSQRHGNVMARLEEIGADSAERRAKSVLENLGFTPELLKRPLSQLSGGFRVRAALSAALFAKADLLLLDEPTNHLSISAVMWLARELSTSETWKQRIIVIVSHDRHFMDEVCTDCLHISGAARRLTQSRGNYSLWAKRRKEDRALFEKEQAKRQTEIDTLREYAGHGFRYGGSSSQIKKMKMKERQSDKLELEQQENASNAAALQEDMELPMKIAAGGELDGYAVQLMGVAFGYPNGPTLFSDCEFGITSKSRIVLLGENGNGKTTLVKLIMGDLQPSAGEIKRNLHARFALVNQHHADQLDLTLTPLQFLQEKFPGDGSNAHLQKLRSHLSSCGVTSESSVAALGGAKTKDLQNTPASALSGGQRSRVALAAVSYVQPHVIALDEPTNNLDLESVAALAECIQKFEGAVICVSHDQFFVQSIANEAWVVDGGKVGQVESFEKYKDAEFKKLKKIGS